MPGPLSPPTPTLLLPLLPHSILLGVDLLTLTTPQPPRIFAGIKDLPPGPHFLFTAETSSHSLRSGFWFVIPAPPCSPPLVIHMWNANSSCLVPCEADSIQGAEHAARLREAGLMSYQQHAQQGSGNDKTQGAWKDLTGHITPALLARVFANLQDWTITTSSCSPQDRDDIPGLSGSEASEGQERELHMLGIDLKRTWRAGAVGRERTEGALDRSWALGDLVGQLAANSSEGNEAIAEQDENKYKDEDEEEEEWGNQILGMMETCFLMTVTLSNYSCLEEWKRILSLVLTCSRALGSHPAFFTTFLHLLLCQLRTAEDVVEGGLFDLSNDDGGEYLKTLLKTFRRTLADIDEEKESGLKEVKEAMRELEAWMEKMYGWEFGGWFVRRGGLVLEDGEVVEMEVDVDELDDGFFTSTEVGGDAVAI